MFVDKTSSTVDGVIKTMKNLNTICWLCLQNKDDLFEIYGKQGNELSVGAILQEHFWFEVGAFAAKNICGNCWAKVESFHVFFNFVKTIHQQQTSETKTIDNGLVCSFKEEPIDIKDVFTDIVETADFLNSQLTILAPHDYNNSPVVIIDKVKVDRTLKRPTISLKTRNLKGSVIKSSETNDFPASRTDKPDVDRRTTKEPFTAEHKTRKYGRKTSTLPSIDEKDASFTSLVSQYFKMACDLCDTSFSSYGDIKKHYRQVHDIQRGYLICCKRKYDSLNVMLSHCEWHINPDAFRCDKCSRSFLDIQSLQRHDHKIHEQKIEFSCIECNQKFSTFNLLSAHRKKHRNLQFKCPICEECFTGKINLRYHIRDKHSPEDEEEFRSSMKSLKKVDQVLEEARQFECDICNSRFIHLSVLRNHIKREHNHRSVRDDGSHICEICAKPFATMHGYKYHYINFHTNELQKVQCDLCGKWFKSKLRIAQHMSWHNSKPATCKICGHVSSNEYALRAHIRRVHREASLECVVCEKKFKSKKVLQEHMAIHAGVTDLYSCTFCTKTFRSNANMYSHRKRAHPAEYEKWRKERKESNLIL